MTEKKFIHKRKGKSLFGYFSGYKELIWVFLRIYKAKAPSLW